MPPQFPVAPGPIPVMMPPPAPARGKGWLWGVVIAAAVLYGLYYIGSHQPQNQPQNPGQAPAPQVQPAAPGPQAQQPGAPTPQAQPGYPQQQPGYQPQQPGYQPQQQPGYPQQQPGAQGGGNPMLVRAQQFVGRWDPVNGYVQVSNAQWRNGANVAVQSVTLECVQFAATGQVITQNQMKLNGPAQPGQIIPFPTFQMGAMMQGLARVQCGIVGAVPAN
jgi:hypothetical protein